MSTQRQDVDYLKLMISEYVDRQAGADLNRMMSDGGRGDARPDTDVAGFKGRINNSSITTIAQLNNAIRTATQYNFSQAEEDLMLRFPSGTADYRDFGVDPPIGFLVTEPAGGGSTGTTRLPVPWATDHTSSGGSSSSRPSTSPPASGSPTSATPGDTGTTRLTVPWATDHTSSGGSSSSRPSTSPVTIDEIKNILRYATNGNFDTLNDNEQRMLTGDWILRTGRSTFDEAAAAVGADSAIQELSARPIGDPRGPQLPGPAPISVPTNTLTTRDFTLIQGDGERNNALALRDNGNAVFLVSGSGELFHVTENLMNEMQANDSWSDPDARSQDEIRGMDLRMSLNHTAELGVLDIPQTGEFMLVRGDGPALSDSQLMGNGDAVYAIDTDGNMFHVTGEVAEQMQANDTWSTPAVLNQGTIDDTPVAGALASPTGGTAELSIPLTADTVVSVAAASASNVLDAGSGTPASTELVLIRGNGPHLGTTQLRGNGAAVYALQPDGTKLHVTGEMYGQLVASGRWYEPQERSQDEIDGIPTPGTLATIDGGVAGFVVPMDAPQVASMAPAPSYSVPAPIAAPTLTQPEREQIAGMYRQYLGREASAGEIDHHGAAILNGTHNMAQININIANSPEANTHQASVVAQADAANIATVNAQVNSFYQQYVGRSADTDDLRIHGSALMGGSVSADTLRQQLAAAPESQAYRSNLINDTYQRYVGRAADSEDHRIHGGNLASGAVDASQFVFHIANAPEAVAYQNSVGMPRYTQ